MRNIEIDIGASIDDLLTNLPSGALSRAINDNMYGINARIKNTTLPISRDNYGYTFFTRPQLNLTAENTSKDRKFASMINAAPVSYQTYTRMMLDPRLAYQGFKSPLADHMQAFLPILTNACTSVSGWPDIAVPEFTTPSGTYSEQMSYTDGFTNEYESFDLSISFLNTRGNYLVYKFWIWLYYQVYVFLGNMDPYYDFIVEHEIDYHTRIYRITTDQTNRYVTNIASTGWAYPTNVPTSALLDYNIDRPYNTNNSEINIRFKCGVLQFNDDVIKLEFNQTQAIHNPNIAALLEHDWTKPPSDPNVLRDDPFREPVIPNCNLRKVPHQTLQLTESSLSNNIFYDTNFNMYPYINIRTNELEWWTPIGNGRGV